MAKAKHMEVAPFDASEYLDNGVETLARQIKSDVPPETSVRAVEDGWD